MSDATRRRVGGADIAPPTRTRRSNLANAQPTTLAERKQMASELVAAGKTQTQIQAALRAKYGIALGCGSISALRQAHLRKQQRMQRTADASGTCKPTKSTQYTSSECELFRRVTIYIPDDLYKLAKIQAVQSDTVLSQLVTDAVRTMLRAHRE